MVSSAGFGNPNCSASSICARPVGPTSSRHVRLSKACLVKETRANDLKIESNGMSVITENYELKIG